MKLKDVLEVVPIKEIIMVVVYNNGNQEKFVGNSMDLNYRIPDCNYRKVFNIHSINNILTIFAE